MGKSFARKCILTEHDEGSYELMCVEKFVQKIMMTEHMKVHTGDILYKCDVHRKCFAHKSI